MPDVNGYLQGLQERLVADGCTVTHEKLGDRTVLVGYKLAGSGGDHPRHRSRVTHAAAP